MRRTADLGVDETTGEPIAFYGFKAFKNNEEVFHRDLQPTHLPVIDTRLHEGVWALIDEGCNTCCHGELWRKNAEMKFRRLGFTPTLETEKESEFKGIGKKESTGVWRIPLGLLLENVDVGYEERKYTVSLHLPGSVLSHEMKGSDHPILLSQGFQAALGFEKDMRFGIIRLKDYDGLGLEVCRQKGSGLFVVRIDRFISEHRDWKCLQNVILSERDGGGEGEEEACIHFTSYTILSWHMVSNDQNTKYQRAQSQRQQNHWLGHGY